MLIWCVMICEPTSISERLGNPGVVLIIDETSMYKRGKKSAEVGMQHSPQAVSALTSEETGGKTGKKKFFSITCSPLQNFSQQETFLLKMIICLSPLSPAVKHLLFLGRLHATRNCKQHHTPSVSHVLRSCSDPGYT